MSENAARDLRIAERWTPSDILVDEVPETDDERARHEEDLGASRNSAGFMKNHWRSWPDLNDENNVAVIVEAEKIATHPTTHNNPEIRWYAHWDKSRHITRGPTRKAAIFALLDPGEDKP